jgi:hypothetical protein
MQREPGWCWGFKSSQRGQGTLAGIALGLILVLGVLIVGVAIPAMDSGGEQESVDSSVDTSLTGFELSVTESNQRALSEGWTSSDLGISPGSDPVDETRGTLTNDDWNSLDSLTRDALVEYTGTYIERTSTSQATQGDLSDIEFVNSPETRNVTSLIGSLSAEGSTAVLVEGVSTVDHATMEVHWLSLPVGASNAVEIVADSGSGTWKAEAWRTPGKYGNSKIAFRADGMGYTEKYSKDYITVDLVEGTVNSDGMSEDDISTSIQDGVLSDTEIRIENADSEWGGVELITDGESPLGPGGETDPENGDMTRDVEVITSAEFDATFQSGSTTRSDRISYSFDPSNAVYIEDDEPVGDPPIPYFKVDITNVDVPIPSDGETTLTLTADITNIGGAEDTQSIVFDTGTGYSQKTDVSLSTSSSTEVTFVWPDASSNPGSHTLTVASDNESGSTSVTINDPDAQFNVDILESELSLPDISEGETGLTIPVKIENVGDIGETKPTTFKIGGESGDVIGEKVRSLGPGSDRTLEFEWPAAGTKPDGVGDITLYAETPDDDDKEKISLTKNGSYFGVTVPDKTVEVGESVSIEATIESQGDEGDTQTITHTGPDGSKQWSVSLSPAQSGSNTEETVSFTWTPTKNDTGGNNVTFSTNQETDSGTITVYNGSESFFSVNITDTNSPVKPGEDVIVTANITNTGGKSGSSGITSTFAPNSFPQTTILSLDPGNSTEQEYKFSTSDSIDLGSHPVTVSTNDDADEEDIVVKEQGEADIRVTSLTAGYDPWPNTKDGGMNFAAVVKNVGDAPGEDTVKLRLPGEDLTIAKAEVDLAAPPEGESCSYVTQDCATTLNNKNWTFVDVPGTGDGKWAPDGENGWWKYSHKGNIYNLMPQTETGTHDDNGYLLYMPNLPNFTIDANPVTDKSVGPGVEAYGVEVTVTNTGDYKGTAHVTASQIESLYSEEGTPPCDDCELIDLPRSLNTGDKFVTLQPGESHSFDRDTFIVPDIHGFQQVEEDLTYNAEVGANGDWAQEDVHETEQPEDSWEWEPPDPPPEETEYKCGDVWIDAERYQAKNGDAIYYDVKGLLCEEGEDPEEGELTIINPSKYSASQTGNSEGDDYTVTDAYVSAYKANIDEDGFQGDWKINVNSGYFSGASDGAGATWLPQDSGGGGE